MCINYMDNKPFLHKISHTQMVAIDLLVIVVNSLIVNYTE